ncbi:hypothetical protein EYF80_003722 [Liparis tanakae]|uniref:Uncharacterized protein n=1 Tax=Liparis tanakae TaxID=230148 RepID=A0A4Z2J848_9TELE|nr:hypothetical protein EYF80_003722 [Liparis tanakae]
MFLTRVPLTRIVSWVGMCPGPPPVISGLKSEVGLRRKLGFRTYPQRPLGRKRPWFRSICSPEVWKFRATERHRDRSQKHGTPENMNDSQLEEKLAQLPSLLSWPKMRPFSSCDQQITQSSSTQRQPWFRALEGKHTYLKIAQLDLNRV